MILVFSSPPRKQILACVETGLALLPGGAETPGSRSAPTEENITKKLRMCFARSRTNSKNGEILGSGSGCPEVRFSIPDQPPETVWNWLGISPEMVRKRFTLHTRIFTSGAAQSPYHYTVSELSDPTISEPFLNRFQTVSEPFPNWCTNLGCVILNLRHNLKFRHFWN